MPDITSYSHDRIDIRLNHQGHQLWLSIYSDAPNHGFNNRHYREGVLRILRSESLLYPLLQPLMQDLNSGVLRLCYAHQHTLLEHEKTKCSDDHQQLSGLFGQRTPVPSLSCYQGNVRLWRLRPGRLYLYWVRDFLPCTTGEHSYGPDCYSNKVMKLGRNSLTGVKAAQQQLHQAISGWLHD